MSVIFLFIAVYLLASIPVGLICSRLVDGSDIRQRGSGNIGATNVTRVLGRKWGILVFAVDFLKGFIAPFLVKAFVPEAAVLLYISAAIIAVIGHNWPVFLKFKGGKGVSTSLGAVVALAMIFANFFLVIVVSVLIWNLIYFSTKMVSLASLSAALALPIFSFVFKVSWEFKLLTILLFVLVLIRHKSNITKIINKTEHKF